MRVLLLCLFLSGCASDRFLSKEEDQAFREKCEATNCVVLPVPLFQQLIEKLRAANMI